MKILLLRQPQTPAGYPGGIAGGACYLTDMLFHGLKDRFGDNIVDYERSWWMYAGDFGPGKFDPAIYCPRGFTIYRTLGDDSQVDRSDIEQKIRDRYFDLIIFGYTHYGLRPGMWELVSSIYPRNQIAFIDGGDPSTVLKPDAVEKSIYFKRELERSQEGVYPISFAIPREKIYTIDTDKINLVAPMDPRNRTSYIYDNEHSYYQQYAESMFGITMKKAGWDCVRHYEILANNCVPLFLDIEHSPQTVMTTLPKKPLVEVLNLAKEKGLEWFATEQGNNTWYELNDEIQQHFVDHCTTESLADYFLSIIGSSV